MKKIILGLIATISNLSIGQATLEHSYTSNYNFNEHPNGFTTESGLNYYTVESPNVMKIYNSSHNLTSTFIIPLENNYVLYGIIGASDKLFNTNDAIEFLIFTYNPIDATYKLDLIDQNGDVLQHFGERNEAAYIIKGISGDFKLITLKYNYILSNGENSTYNIYSLPGTILGNVSSNIVSNSLIGYPNPTENKIAISSNLIGGQNGILEIFDMSGKKILQKNIVGEGKSEVSIDVNELSNGVYIYKLNGQTNKFIKK